MREQFLESGRFLLGQWKKFLIVLGLFLALSVGTAVVMTGQPEQDSTDSLDTSADGTDVQTTEESVTDESQDASGEQAGETAE